MNINYVVTVSTGNDAENHAVRDAGKKFIDAERVYNRVVQSYTSKSGGPFTISLVKVNSDARSVDVIREDVTGLAVD